MNIPALVVYVDMKRPCCGVPFPKELKHKRRPSSQGTEVKKMWSDPPFGVLKPVMSLQSKLIISSASHLEVQGGKLRSVISLEEKYAKLMDDDAKAVKYER